MDVTKTLTVEEKPVERFVNSLSTYEEEKILRPILYDLDDVMWGYSLDRSRNPIVRVWLGEAGP